MLAERRLLVATLGYLAALGAATWELVRWADPLPDELTLGLLALAHVVAGALADRWRAVLLALALAFVGVVVGEGLQILLVLVVAVPAAVVLLAAGVAVGKLARRRSRTRRRREWPGAAPLAATLAACALLPGAAAAFDALRPPVDHTPEDPLVLDPVRGTFRGIALGDPAAEVVRRIGRPERRGQNQPSEPIGEDYYEIGGPTSQGVPPGTEEALRYRELTVFTAGGRVYGFVVTSERAQTPEGVGVGDSRALVERRYDGADCYVANEGTEYATFPVCEVIVCAGRRLAFGSERIKSVWLTAETRAAMDRCARPGEG